MVEIGQRSIIFSIPPRKLTTHKVLKKNLSENGLVKVFVEAKKFGINFFLLLGYA